MSEDSTAGGRVRKGSNVAELGAGVGPVEVKGEKQGEREGHGANEPPFHS